MWIDESIELINSSRKEVIDYMYIYYLLAGCKVDMLELDEELTIDFINDIIESGFDDFEIYSGLSNVGLFDKIVKVESSKIVYLELADE